MNGWFVLASGLRGVCVCAAFMVPDVGVRSPCSLIWRIWRTVSLRMAHLSGLTLKLSMSLRLAEISSASSSMYLLSCSRRFLSHLQETSYRDWSQTKPLLHFSIIFSVPHNSESISWLLQNTVEQNAKVSKSILFWKKALSYRREMVLTWLFPFL